MPSSPIWSPELLAALAAIPVEFDLIVTNATGAAAAVGHQRLARARNVIVLPVANHGRDIWPMVQVVNAGVLDPYELVLKVHTKRSEWRAAHQELSGSGEQWRSELIGSLLGSTEHVQQILSAFAEDPDLGVVTAPGSLLGPEFWGGDRELVAELLRRLELTLDPDALRFPAGSFYWIRAFVLQGLRALSMTEDDFDDEAGQVDATTAHAVERSIGILSRGGRPEHAHAGPAGAARAGLLAAVPARCQPGPPGPGAAVLPAAVPSHPGEQPLVGRGLHRVGQRDRRPAGLPRPQPAEPAVRAGLLRPAAGRGAAGPDGPGQPSTASPVSCTTTTGSPAGGC